MADLSDWITPASLREAAGDTVFGRGEAYFRGGAVSRLNDTGSRLTARVHGTETYEVELWTEGDELEYDCTCPHAAEGFFCKHCVAAGLAFLAGREESGGPPDLPADPQALIRNFLLLQTPETLADWLLDAARGDEALYRTLLLKAERAGGAEAVDMARSFRREIDSATNVRGFVEYGEAGSFADELHQLVDALGELLESETAAILVDLAEHAIERVEMALESVDDSNGEVGGVLARLAEMHLQACEMARPDPVALAERLFRYETTAPFDTFSNSIRTYWDVLGPAGQQRFRELAEEAWRGVNPRSEGSSYDSRRWHITQIMETLAELAGDVEALVAIKSRDLSLPYYYLAIAEIYRKASKPEQALDWAERGMAAFPDRPDNRLRDFLAAEYLERGRRDEALQLVWIQFAEQPNLDHYRKLHGMAERLGIWPAQRDRALAELDAATLRQANTLTAWKTKPSTPDRSERVRIALWEDDLEAAWQAMQLGTCQRDVPLTLAGRLEADRPADAVELYRRVIPAIVGETSNRAYERAIGLIRKVGGLMRRLGRDGEFGEYMAELRVNYKPKRNFIKLLDTVRVDR